MNKIELFNDHFQNFKKYLSCKAQLIIADPPYNLGVNAYASNPSWYVGGDNKNGESELAGREFFDTDKNFKPAEFMHFCSQMLVKEPKEPNKAPCTAPVHIRCAGLIYPSTSPLSCSQRS